MAQTIKQLIQRNKAAFDEKFFIESISLTYILINKAVKQIVKEELQQELMDQKIKTSFLLKFIKKNHLEVAGLKTKLPKKVIKDVELFIALYKEINQELKFQLPEKKIHDTAQLGINCIVMLNNSLLKIKNNGVN